MYPTPYGDNSLTGADMAVLISFMLGYVVVALVIYVLFALGLSRILKKYNHPQPWAAWVPVYNVWVLLELGRQPGWYALLAIAGAIPVIGPLAAVLVVVVEIFAFININKAFGKSLGGYTVLAALLTPVWALMLGFGKDQPVLARSNGPYFPPAKAEAQPQYAQAQYSQPQYPQQGQPTQQQYQAPPQQDVAGTDLTETQDPTKPPQS